MPPDFDPSSVQLSASGPPGAPPTKTRRKGLVVAWLVALLLVVGLGVYAYRHLARSAPTVVRPQPSEAPAATAPTLPPADEAAPTAEAALHGDALMTEWASRLFDGLDGRWTEGGDLARRLAGVIAAVAGGEYPRPFLLPLVPRQPFAPEEKDGVLTLSTASQARYDGVTRTLATLHSDRIAAAWAAVHPLVAAAWQEIAPRGSRLDDALDHALAQVIATPVPEGPLALVPHGAVYQFADAKLEALEPTQKLLIRMGPVNQRRVQAQARKVGQALGLPSAR